MLLAWMWACKPSGTESECAFVAEGLNIGVEVSEIKTTKTLKDNSTDLFYYIFSLKVGQRPKVLGVSESKYFSQRQDINKICNSLKVHFSPDKEHFVISVAGKSKALYHLLDSGAPFSSDFYRQYSEEFADLSDIEWQILPSAQRIATVLLHNNRRYRELNAMAAEEVAVSLYQQPLACALDSAIAKLYPQSDLAKKVMMMGKAEQMATLNDSFFRPQILSHFNDATAFDINQRIAYATGEPIFFDALDRVALTSWLQADSTTAYLYRRLGDKMSIEKSLLDKMKTASLSYLQRDQGSYFPFLSEAIFCLDKTCNPKEFDRILEQVFKLVEYNSEEIHKALVLDYHRMRNQVPIQRAWLIHWATTPNKLKQSSAKLLSQVLKPTTLDTMKAKFQDFEKMTR